MAVSNVRVRFAPSPTGYPHVGNIRTALFNWLYARHMGGKFILRIEDTDQARKVEGSVEAIMDGLHWMGIDWDEGPVVGGQYGPYYQSERLAFYQSATRKLVDEGYAYPCFCSADRLVDMRKEQENKKLPLGYDRNCRDLSSLLVAGVKNATPVIRFKTPLEGQTKFIDLIKGEVCFDNRTQDDLVLLKSDGYPTYHLANVVDDHLMKITHVLRADEWLSSTPKHLLLYKALGWQPPQFAHLPMILGKDKNKLSKRHGSTSIIEYRSQGYLPQTMVNFLALLGWSLDDRTEFFTVEELIKQFSIEHISKSSAVFDMDKLKWMNGTYIRALDLDVLTDCLMPFLDRGLPPTSVERPLDKNYVRQIVPLIRKRITTLEEAVSACEFFFVDNNFVYDIKMLLGRNLTKEKASQGLTSTLIVLTNVVEYKSELLEDELRALADALEVKVSDFFGLLRVALTGRTVSPPLFQVMEVLGRERCIRRIVAASHYVGESISLDKEGK